MNIVFVVIDTLRADHLGCYGYAKPTSPAIDSLAAQGARFTRCLAPGIPTTPAHTTMFTGLHPINHNIVCHGGSVDLDRKIPVLPEMLQNRGYTTAAVDNLYDIKPWFARGYEFYINPSFRHKLRLLVSADEINARAIEWLQGHRHEDFFLFLHYWDPHTPYMPPEKYRTFYPKDRNPFSPAFSSFAPVKSQPIYGMFGDLWFDKLGPITDADYVSSLYDAEIKRVDDGIADLLAALDRLELADNTLVILTGDHGESLTEHDIYFDHHGLYEPTVHVPLLMRLPGAIAPHSTVTPLVQHLDLAPTILDACSSVVSDSSSNSSPDLLSRDKRQSKPIAPMDGRSLWPLATGQTTQGTWDRVYSCESTWQSKWSMRTEDLKLIVSLLPDRHHMPMRELYDLTEDPNELTNLAEVRPELADIMEAELEAWIADNLARTGRTEDPLRVQGISLGKRWDDWVKK